MNEERVIYSPEQTKQRCFFNYEKICDGTFWNYTACRDHEEGWKEKPKHAIDNMCRVCHLFPEGKVESS